MTGLIIMYAPSAAAANAGETAVNSGTVWGVTVSLAHRSGRYLAVLCAPTSKPTMVSNAEQNGWRLICHGLRVSPSDLLESDIGMVAYVSGLLDERGA